MCYPVGLPCDPPCRQAQVSDEKRFQGPRNLRKEPVEPVELLYTLPGIILGVDGMAPLNYHFPEYQ